MSALRATASLDADVLRAVAIRAHGFVIGENMKITSTFVQPVAATSERIRQILAESGSGGAQQAQLFVFDTFIEGKSLVTGITVGKVNGQSIDDVKVSPVGMAIIGCLGDHHALNYPGQPVIIAGVQQVPGAVDRVRKVLQKAPLGAAVLFVCADGKVYDAAVPGLGVDYHSAKQDPQ